MKKIGLLAMLGLLLGCSQEKNQKPISQKTQDTFVWENATIYFMLTDRFNNGSSENDVNFDRTKETGKLRGFEGGDIRGVINKIDENYFTDLGVDAIWLTPVYEQIHGSVDEGTGNTYAFHGYWPRDWSNLEPNFGSEDDLRELVEKAHSKGIRVVLDAVINHTGPVTDLDPVWPNEWVRTSPRCTYQNYETTVSCTLVDNLPDIKTETNSDVDLPESLVEKWKQEGRYEQEVAELDEFFESTGYPRAPKYYIMKWLADYIIEFGIDGYRADTVKHTEEDVWQDFRKVCDDAYATFKKNNPTKVISDDNFYLVAEVYNYGISGGRYFDFGDKKVDYFKDAFTSSINFEFKWNAKQNTYEEIFSRYASILNNELKGYGVLNYISSHDDGQPFDPTREKPYEAANKLLLSPGAAQIYYGDETARSLVIEGTVGDATLRSFMNWEELAVNEATQSILKHWQKLGKFRKNHPSIGAGLHNMISESPYYFSRTLSSEKFDDSVIIGLDIKDLNKEVNVSSVFENNEVLYEAYSNQVVVVTNGVVKFESPFEVVLLEKSK